MKKVTALFLSTLMVLTLVISMATFAVSAENTPVTADKTWYNETQTEFTLTTPAQFLGFAELINGVKNQTGDAYIDEPVTFEGKTVKLGNDITMNEGFDGNKPADASNLVEYPLVQGEFHGTFDGQNHAIIGIYQVDKTEEGVNQYGLFGNVMTTGKTATIKNLAIIKSNMLVKGIRIGGLLGRIHGTANISNCYVDVNMDFGVDPSLDRWGYGGFIGALNNNDAVVDISNCVFAGDLNIPDTRAMVAGFIARAEKFKTVTITNCAMYGNIPTGSSNAVSGIVGRIQVVEGASATFDGCICAGDGTGFTGAFWTPHGMNMNNASKVDVQIKKSLYTLTYPDASAFTDVDESVIIEGETIFGTAAASVLTENGLTDWDAIDGYYPLPKAMSGMVAALQLPKLEVEGGDQPGDEPGNQPGDEPTDTDPVDTDDTTPDTQKPATSDTKAPETETPANGEKGCGGIIGGGIALVAVAAVGSCVFVAKKKD